MELGFGPAVTAAIISGIISIIVTMATLTLGRERLGREFKLEFATEIAITALLGAGEYDMRTFDKIKGYLPGFADDDELRRALIRSGGVRFARKKDGAELWGLLANHQGEAFR